MANYRNALDKHLGVTEQDYSRLRYERYRALMDYVGQALDLENYAAAQVYATLLLAEAQDAGSTIDVNLMNWEDLAVGIASNLTPDLQRIANNIG